MLHMNTTVNTLQIPLVGWAKATWKNKQTKTILKKKREKKLTLAYISINMIVYAVIDIPTTRGVTILRLFSHGDNEMFNAIINL